MNFVDLAGSERLSKSGATGDRAAEARAINKSLSALGNVISSLLRGDAHIPFRDSKLTYVLQGSLVSGAKALMVACLAPEADHGDETLCTLRFAKKVNACEPKRCKS